ncbi:MAG: SusC/RagA family TonB-linked outer membrane protein [Prolixibacteraceae bacterium]|jgi:hypothetical protein
MKKKMNLVCPSLAGYRKTFLIMRVSLFFILISAFQVLAGNSYSQSTRLSLNMKNSTIREVLGQIEDHSDFYFLYNNQLIDVERRVNIDVKDEKIDVILSKLFDDGSVNAVIRDRHIILVPNETVNSLPQQKTVSGKITDTSGAPLPGVSVVLKGTTTGTITDGNGNFSLSNIPENQVLLFSFIGMKTQELNVGTKTSLTIVMETETYGVGEVVVTALGFKREEKALGYAVQKVSGSGLQTVKGIDIGTSLTGKVAGLLVKNSTEFASEPDVQIRGEKPLLVIDGVPYGNMSLRDLPSDDIESISVLKGATASALYGYRGASGAIMVTTIKGNANKGLSVSVNSGSMFTAGFLAIPKLQSVYGRVVNSATNTYVRSGDGSWGPPLEGQDVIQWDPVTKTMKSMPYLPIGKDNFNNFLEQGYILNNNINVVQQGEFGSFRSSVTWVKNKGQYPNSMFDKVTYSIGGDMKVNKFTLSSNFSYNKQISPNIGFGGYAGYDPMYSMLIWAGPDWDIRDYKDYWVVPNEIQNSSYTGTNNNPYFDRYERTHSLNKDILNGTLSLDYDLTPWLKATVRTGFDSYSNKQEIQISKGSFVSAGTATIIDNGVQVWGESMKGSYNLGLGRGYSLNSDFLLSGNKKIGDFNIDGFAGGTIYYREDEGIDSRTQGGLSIPAFYSLKASINPASVSSSVYKQQVNSVYGRLSFSWKSLVYTEGTLRNDWSSTLPKSTRSYLYPSVAASFVVSELLPKMDWLSMWKLRGSWTSSKGMANIYDINSVYSITNSAWGSLSAASFPSTIRGADVRPASASTFEVGTALNLYKNRASVDVSYYTKRNYDNIIKASISPSSGYSSNYINTEEEITRKGLEVTINGTPVKSHDWKWDVSLNWTTYARFYTKLDPVFFTDKPWIKVGERVDHYILRDYQRDSEGNIIHNNGQPLYSAYDSKFGYSDPDWIWGANSTLSYKNLRFNISVDGRVGGLAQTTTEMYMWRAGSHPNSVVPERYLDATQPGTKNYIGKGVKVVSGTVAYDTYGNITSDTRVFAPNDVAVTYKTYLENLHKGTAWGGSPSPLDAYSTTFFKIREMSLTYDLPRSITTKFYAKGVSVSAVGQNVLLWAKQFKYSDPDGGSENFSDPSQRYLGFNLKVTF